MRLASKTPSRFGKRAGAATAAAMMVAGALFLAPDAEAAEAADPSARPLAFREMKWDELVPKDWDPYKGFKIVDPMLSDQDPRAFDLLRRMREAWDAAPTVSALEGARVKLPGYVVPLEEVRGELREFLLVPYFGACIHTPPPPANQIVFVVAPKGVRFRAMETVWASGVLHATRQRSYMGSSGYRMEATMVEAYAPTGRP